MQKYYLDAVMDELNTTNTYMQHNKECKQVIMKHLKYMDNNGLEVRPEHESLPSFYWLPKLHK